MDKRRQLLRRLLEHIARGDAAKRRARYPRVEAEIPWSALSSSPLVIACGGIGAGPRSHGRFGVLCWPYWRREQLRHRTARHWQQAKAAGTPICVRARSAVVIKARPHRRARARLGARPARRSMPLRALTTPAVSMLAVISLAPYSVGYLVPGTALATCKGTGDANRIADAGRGQARAQVTRKVRLISRDVVDHCPGWKQAPQRPSCHVTSE